MSTDEIIFRHTEQFRIFVLEGEAFKFFCHAFCILLHHASTGFMMSVILNLLVSIVVSIVKVITVKIFNAWVIMVFVLCFHSVVHDFHLTIYVHVLMKNCCIEEQKGKWPYSLTKPMLIGKTCFCFCKLWPVQSEKNIYPHHVYVLIYQSENLGLHSWFVSQTCVSLLSLVRSVSVCVYVLALSSC